MRPGPERFGRTTADAGSNASDGPVLDSEAMTEHADHALGTSRPRLLRRLGTTDAVLLGLGSVISTGVFVVYAPAAPAAGSGLLIGLVVAAFVAYANATSSAEPAARYPASGGTYVDGRQRLGELWGFLVTDR